MRSGIILGVIVLVAIVLYVLLSGDDRKENTAETPVESEAQLIAAEDASGPEVLDSEKSEVDTERGAPQAAEALSHDSSADSVRGAINQKIRTLPEKIRNAPDLKAAWQLLTEAEESAKQIRADAPRQPEFDEVHMDMLFNSLAEIPRDKGFSKEKCSEYRNQIYAEYSPMPGEDGSRPDSVQMTINVLNALCAK